MKCPACSHSLSFLITDRPTCKHCGQELRATNSYKVHVPLIVIFVATTKLFIAKLFDENIFFAIILLGISIIVFQGLRNIFINYEAIDKKDSDERWN